MLQSNKHIFCTRPGPTANFRSLAAWDIGASCAMKPPSTALLPLFGLHLLLHRGNRQQSLQIQSPASGPQRVGTPRWLTMETRLCGRSHCQPLVFTVTTPVPSPTKYDLTGGNRSSILSPIKLVEPIYHCTFPHFYIYPLLVRGIYLVDTDVAKASAILPL